ncbi:uncharacterized protein ACB058_000291 [Synchiropus picturatus]
MADKRGRVQISEVEKMEETVARLTTIFTKTFKMSSRLSPTLPESKDGVDELVFEIVHSAAKDVTELRRSIRQWEQEEQAKFSRREDESAAKSRLCQKLDRYLNTFFAQRRACGDCGVKGDFEDSSISEMLSTMKAASEPPNVTLTKKKKKKKPPKISDDVFNAPAFVWNPVVKDDNDEDVWKESSDGKAVDECGGDTAHHTGDPGGEDDEAGLTINLVMRNFFCSLSDEQIWAMGNGIGTILVREQLIDMCMEMLQTSTKALSVCQSK